MILENSIPAILSGTYVPSRSYGNPLYEFIAAFIYNDGGYVLVNCFSVVLSMLSLLLFDTLLSPNISKLRRALAIGAIAFSPMFLSQSSAFTEWMLAVFLMLCLIVSVRQWIDCRTLSALACYGLFSSLMVLTRPDWAVVCFGLCLATLWQIGFVWRDSLRLLGVSLLAGAMTLAVFLTINHGAGFLQQGVSGVASWSRRIVVAIVGMVTIFGFLGVPLMVLLTMDAGRRALSRRSLPIGFYGRLFLILLPVLFFRFTILPDKLEYILPLTIFFVLMVANEPYRLSWLALVAVSMTVSSVVNVSLFERRGTDDHLLFGVHLQPGALVQDWRIAHYELLSMDPAFLARIAAVVYPDLPQPPRVTGSLYGPGLLSDAGDMIIGQDEAYRLDNPRQRPVYQRSLYRAIYICDRSVFHGNLGWRLMEAPVQRPSVNPLTGELDLHCHRESAGSDQ